MKLGRVHVDHSYIVDIEDKGMVEEAISCLYEDLMNAYKNDELFDWIDTSDVEELKKKSELTEDDIPEFLTENQE